MAEASDLIDRHDAEKRSRQPLRWCAIAWTLALFFSDFRLIEVLVAAYEVATNSWGRDENSPHGSHPRRCVSHARLLLSAAPSTAQQAYESRSEGNESRRSTYSRHPPSPMLRQPGPAATPPSSNGITYIDVGRARGSTYRTAITERAGGTANPLDPSQIVLTSFSGSGWGWAETRRSSIRATRERPGPTTLPCLLRPGRSPRQ
jgi:hypothetical protein